MDTGGIGLCPPCFVARNQLILSTESLGGKPTSTVSYPAERCCRLRGDAHAVKGYGENQDHGRLEKSGSTPNRIGTGTCALRAPEPVPFSPDRYTESCTAHEEKLIVALRIAATRFHAATSSVLTCCRSTTLPRTQSRRPPSEPRRVADMLPHWLSGVIKNRMGGTHGLSRQ